MKILTSIKEAWKYNEDIIVPIMWAIIITAIVVAISIGSVYFLKENECDSKASILNTESSYGLFQGCFIKYKEEWIDYDRYITIKE